MNEIERKRMTELCDAIVCEQDDKEMMKLVIELNALLEKKQERLNKKQREADGTQG